MKFREHRGGFNESMETVKEFTSIDSFREFLESIWETPIDSIKFALKGADRRNGWDRTYLVMVDFSGVTPDCPVGWSDDLLNE